MTEAKERQTSDKIRIRTGVVIGALEGKEDCMTLEVCCGLLLSIVCTNEEVGVVVVLLNGESAV
jgi:hypothetical protein